MSRPVPKWIKARVSEPDYAALAHRAGLAGLTLSAYVRRLVGVERETVDVAGAMRDLETRLRGDLGGPGAALEPLVVESVLLARELLALREPQALPRVRAQLDARFPGRARL